MLVFPNFITKVRRNIYQGFKTLLSLRKIIEDFGLLCQAEAEQMHWGHLASVQYWG